MPFCRVRFAKPQFAEYGTFGGPADRSNLQFSTLGRPPSVSQVTELSGDTTSKEVDSVLQCRVTVAADVHPIPTVFPELMRCADGCDCVKITTTTQSPPPQNVMDSGTKVTVTAHREVSIPTAETSGPPPGTVLPCTLERLRAEQEKDEVVGIVLRLLKEFTQKPDWDTIALKHRDVKVLWAARPRLEIRDGLLKRRFEEVNGKEVRWQVVVPKALRQSLMSIAHGGMTGGHLGRRKTAAAVQSRAYWPTWSSDLDTFLKQCTTCSSYHRGALPRRAPMQTPLVGEPWE